MITLDSLFIAGCRRLIEILAKSAQSKGGISHGLICVLLHF